MMFENKKLTDNIDGIPFRIYNHKLQDLEIHKELYDKLYSILETKDKIDLLCEAVRYNYWEDSVGYKIFKFEDSHPEYTEELKEEILDVFSVEYGHITDYEKWKNYTCVEEYPISYWEDIKTNFKGLADNNVYKCQVFIRKDTNGDILFDLVETSYLISITKAGKEYLIATTLSMTFDYLKKIEKKIKLSFIVDSTLLPSKDNENSYIEPIHLHRSLLPSSNQGDLTSLELGTLYDIMSRELSDNYRLKKYVNSGVNNSAGGTKKYFICIDTQQEADIYILDIVDVNTKFNRPYKLKINKK